MARTMGLALINSRFQPIEAFRILRRGVRLGSWPLLQRYIVAPRVFNLPPQPVNFDGQHEFHFVAGKRHEIMLHWAVRSLLQHHLDKVSIYLHSDRSITPQMQARFWSTFPGSVVIGDGEADDRANEK